MLLKEVQLETIPDVGYKKLCVIIYKLQLQKRIKITSI